MRQYTSSSGPTQIAGTRQSSYHFGTSDKDELKRRKQAAEIIADKAREISGKWSTKIPGSIEVAQNSKGDTFVTAGGPTAPAAYPSDPPPGVKHGKGEGVRHPLFGNRKHWYPAPYRPFLEEAIEQAGDKAAEAYANVIDDWAKELGTDH